MRLSPLVSSCKLGRQRFETGRVSFTAQQFDCRRFPVVIAKRAQCLDQKPDPRAKWKAAVQNADAPQFVRLLRTRRERPRDRRATEHGYKSPSANADCHSIPNGIIPPQFEERLSRPNRQVCDRLHAKRLAVLAPNGHADRPISDIGCALRQWF